MQAPAFTGEACMPNGDFKVRSPYIHSLCRFIFWKIALGLIRGLIRIKWVLALVLGSLIDVCDQRAH